MSGRSINIRQLILESHLWLGISAMVCTWGTFVLLQQAVPFRYLGFILAGTVFIYTYHGIQTRKAGEKMPEDDEPIATGILWFVCLLGGIGSMILYLTLDHMVQVFMLFPAAMAILYVVPLYKGRRLKDYPFIKIAAVVIAWTIITYAIPVQKISEWSTNWGYHFLMLDRLLFFFALAIPFDIRDIDFDREHSLKTIPNTIGVENSQNLALFSIFLAAGFMTMGFDLLGLEDMVRIGILAVYILIGVVIIQLKYRPGKTYYGWVIDGFLLLYGLSILLLSR